MSAELASLSLRPSGLGLLSLEDHRMTYDAHKLLLEAGDTLESTYWTTANEFDVHAQYTTHDKYLEAVAAKHLPAKHKTYVTKDGGTRVVTGMCSIGALALAMHMNSATPLVNYNVYERNDWSTFLAGMTLLRVLQENADEDALWALNETPGSLIAKWNDSLSQSDTDDRALVVQRFREAAVHPMTAVGTVVLFCVGNVWLYWPCLNENEARVLWEEREAVWQACRDKDLHHKDIYGIDDPSLLTPFVRSLHHSGWFSAGLQIIKVDKNNFRTGVL